eukprot:TRINITY_DN526_c0_g1_i3.p1 TRINITY_DN526_c0_g1~~TRINITY_DN526_c0_g1_i3.p1  ORF type:complete len:1056 (-),score=196.35 TRINITY_DN526_c0_g1_i3:69-3236(-)
MLIHCCILILILPWNVLAQDVLQKELHLSTPRTSFTSVEAGDKIYFVGGFENGDRTSSAIDVFDIATQTWNRTLTLPSPRAFITPAVIPPHLYFVSGWENKFNVNPYNYDSGNLNALQKPQIKTPTQMIIHNTTLFVIGSYEAKFMDLTDTGSGWSTRDDLSYLLQRISGAITFGHENLIFVVGGVNVSSRQKVRDTWIYDTESSILTRHDSPIDPIGYIAPNEYSFSVANDIMAIGLNTGKCILYNMNTSTWLNVTTRRQIDIISVPGYSYIISSAGYYTIDWSNPSPDLFFTTVSSSIIDTISYEDQAALLLAQFQGESVMLCTNNNTWISSVLTPSINDIQLTVLWPSHGYIIVTTFGFYVFKDCSVTFIALERIQSIVVSYPAAEEIFVTIQNAFVATSDIRVYNSTLDYVRSNTVPSITPSVSFDNILFDLVNVIAVSLNSGLSLDILPYDSFSTNTFWAVQDEQFVILTTRSNEIQLSNQVDIYNYENNTWLPSTTNSISTLPLYAQAFNLDGKLGLISVQGILTFDVTTYEWTSEALGAGSKDLPNPSIAPLMLDINGTAYITTNLVRLRIISDGNVSLSGILSEANDEIPVQMIYNELFNQIFISTTKNMIYTWNIGNQQQNIFLFPRQDEKAFVMATSGNFLLAASTNSTEFDYCDLSSSRWGTIPNITNHVFPAAMRTFQTNTNNTGLILIAGGQDKDYSFFTDTVRVFDISSLQSLPAVPVEAVPITTPEDYGLQQANTTLIVAIVVPVGAVLIAGALLAFFLVRRKQRRQRRGNRTSTVGLEAQYGQWFIPFSDLTFHEQLGQGGSGQVFKGSWKNTSVALKVSMTQAHSSVISELTLMMQLRPHPNVVQLLGFSVHPETDSIVLVLEYCNQGALDSLLFDGKKAVTMKQKLEWLIGISKGLSHLHSNNIVHRDVAARNILLHQNEAKVTDFGMSRVVSENQRGTTKSELGPIRWMAPESLKAKEYSAKSDVWSFGILAFEVIAQQEPHAEVDPIQVGRLIRDEGLTPHLPDTCPIELAPLIKSCLHMEPKQRPTAEQLTSQL